MKISPTTKANLTRGSRGLRSGWGIFRSFRTFLIFFVFALILLNALIIAIDNKSPEPALEYLGGKFIYPTHILYEESTAIIDNQGIWVREDNFFRNSWSFISTFWSLFTALFIIFIWVKVLSWIVMKVFVQDDSKTTASFLIALMMFFGVQSLFFALFRRDELWWTPIKAFIQFFKAIPYLLKPAIHVADKFVNGQEVMNSTINDSLGNLG